MPREAWFKYDLGTQQGSLSEFEYTVAVTLLKVGMLKLPKPNARMNEGERMLLNSLRDLKRKKLIKTEYRKAAEGGLVKVAIPTSRLNKVIYGVRK